MLIRTLTRFLHASLQLDALWDCTNVSDIEKTLDEFPRRIEDVYKRTWKRILDQTPAMTELAQKVLVWVLCSTRSLKIEELRHVLAICPRTHRFNPSHIVDEGTLLGLCRGLVNVEDNTNLVRFVRKLRVTSLEIWG
jgi:ankyrin repeat domain-containing protein 50